MATPVWELRSEGRGPLHITLANRVEGTTLNHRFASARIANGVCDLLNEHEEMLRQADADTGEWPPLGEMRAAGMP